MRGAISSIRVARCWLRRAQNISIQRFGHFLGRENASTKTGTPFMATAWAIPAKRCALRNRDAERCALG